MVICDQQLIETAIYLVVLVLVENGQIEPVSG